MSTHVLALDQGTTSSRAIVFDLDGTMLGIGQHEFAQHYPQPGWVEHDPEEIWSSEQAAIAEALAAAGVGPADIAAIGITNQRETTVVWNRATGEPVMNAIVWQCRRTAGMCDALRAQGREPLVRERTGLVIDAYFSGTKVAWVLKHVPEARRLAEEGVLAFGTVDSWLIWKLTGGREHLTDATNASRTMLFDIHSGTWDPDLLGMLDVPASMCPRVVDSAGVLAETDPAVFGARVPIAGIAGDQQAALFGQACIEPGMAKNTYGTGSFLLQTTGQTPVHSTKGLLTTIAWSIGGQRTYALEGSIFVTGAVVQWLRDGLGLIERAEDTEAIAGEVPDTGGVVVVPAFVGLGAPVWDPYARGTIVGITRGTTRAHLVRAALESMAYQTRDVVEAMAEDAGQRLGVLRVDGGAVRNNLVAQLQADVLGIPVERPRVTETTALGAAYLAAVGIGAVRGPEGLAELWHLERRFEPSWDDQRREAAYRTWQRARERARGWIEP